MTGMKYATVEQAQVSITTFFYSQLRAEYLGDIMKVRLNFHHDAEVLEPIKQPVVVGCLSKISTRELPMGMVDLYKDGEQCNVLNYFL